MSKPFRISNETGAAGPAPVAGPQTFGRDGAGHQAPPEGSSKFVHAWRPGIGQNSAAIAQQRNPYEPIPRKPLPAKV